MPFVPSSFLLETAKMAIRFQWQVGFLARLALLSAMESASRWARSLQLWPKTAALAEEQVGEGAKQVWNLKI